MANVLKGGSAVMLSFISSSRTTTTLSRTTTNYSFLPKFPFLSLSSSSRPKTPSSFSSFCTLSSSPETVTEPIAVENNGENNEKSSIKDAAGLLDIRVGQIVKAWKHDEAESLYVEEVDIGEPEPRIICSGLVNYIPLENLQVLLFLLNSIKLCFTPNITFFVHFTPFQYEIVLVMNQDCVVLVVNSLYFLSM